MNPRHSFRPIVAVEGPSAAGKTTIVEAISALRGGTVLREAFDRLSPHPDLTFGSNVELLQIERRLFDEDCRRFAEARKAQRRDHSVWLDTDFLGPLTYSAGLYALNEIRWNVVPELGRIALLRILARRWGLADVYVYLDVPGSLRRSRARNDPLGHPMDLWMRHERVGRFERRFYLGVLREALRGRLCSVDGQGTVKQTARRVLRVVDNVEATTNSSSGDARRVVQSLIRWSGISAGRITRARSSPPRRPS